jgi:hypothetical protein
MYGGCWRRRRQKISLCVLCFACRKKMAEGEGAKHGVGG